MSNDIHSMLNDLKSKLADMTTYEYRVRILDMKRRTVRDYPDVYLVGHIEKPKDYEFIAAMLYAQSPDLTIINRPTTTTYPTIKQSYNIARGRSEDLKRLVDDYPRFIESLSVNGTPDLFMMDLENLSFNFTEVKSWGSGLQMNQIDWLIEHDEYQSQIMYVDFIGGQHGSQFILEEMIDE